MRRTIKVAMAALLCCAGSSAALAAEWQLAGTTYNSVAFVDVASVATQGSTKSFIAMRVSGQPAKDGWASVVEKLSANCDTGIFVDMGSAIEQADGSIKRYPGFGASQRAVSRGVFHDMFEIVCSGRSGTTVTDPKSWTRRNFTVGS